MVTLPKIPSETGAAGMMNSRRAVATLPCDKRQNGTKKPNNMFFLPVAGV